MDTKVDLLLAISSHRVVSAPTTHSLENLRIAQIKGELNFTYSLGLFIGDALIGRSRSQACSKFLEESTVPYMLFIDDDIIFNPNDVKRIYDHLSSGNYDVIGGIYPVRGASQLSSYGWGGKLAMDGKIQEIEYLATGFMGISRRILEKVKNECPYEWIDDNGKVHLEKGLPLLNPNDWARCYPFFEGRGWKSAKRAKGGDAIYISEDWFFCELVRRVGGKIYADTDVQLGHIREEIFTPQTVYKVQAEADIQTRTYGAVNHQNELIRSVDTDLKEFLEIPLEKSQDKLKRARVDLSNRWRGYKGISEDFYKDNVDILWDNASFNYKQGYFQMRLGALYGIRGAKILDIGCGIGSAVFMMSEQENEVVGWDINKQCIDFCNFKKNKYKLKGEFTTEKPDFSKFNLILAIDVLPNIENLEGFLKELGQGMEYGTKFYHLEDFPQKDKEADLLVYPMRFEENKEHLSDWFKQSGLIEWDGIWTVKG